MKPTATRFLPGHKMVRRSSTFLHSMFFFFIFFFAIKSASFSQVNIAYADTMYPRWIHDQSYISISGKRILNSDTLVNDGRLLQFSNCSNIYISNCIFGPSVNLGLYFYNCSNVTITNCIFLDNVSAITIDGGNNYKINYNQFSNALNNAGWWNVPNPHGDRGSFIQILHVIDGSGFEVKYNVGENTPGFNNAEDLINVGGSSFTSAMDIIGNRFRGSSETSWHGAGINAGDDGDSTDPVASVWPVTGPINVKNNILYNAGAVGIWVTGHNSVFEDNVVYEEYKAYVSNGGLMVGSTRKNCPTLTIKRNKVNYTQGIFGPPPSANHIYAPGCMANVTWGTGADANDPGATILPSVLPAKLLGSFLAVHYKLHNDWNDYAGGHMTATPHGTTIVCDNVRKAATFNGTSSDWLEVPRSPWLKPNTQKITISAWIKPSAVSNYQGIIRSQDAGGWTEGWRMVLDNGTFVARVVTNNGDISVYCPGISANQWSQVAFTYDGNVLKGYVNGTLVDSAVQAGYITYFTSTQNGMVIGGSEGTYNFYGLIAEVKAWYGDRDASELYSDWYNSAGFFDGSISNPELPISATYSANGQSKVMDYFESVLSNSNGQITGSPSYYNMQWQLLSGTTNYEYSFGGTDYLSIPNYSSVQMRLTVSEGYCMLPAWRDYYIYADMYQLFSVKLVPGNGDVIVSKPAPEVSAPQPLLPGNRRMPVLNAEVYSVQVVNMLGQVITSGIYKDGQLKLNIGNAIAGVYVVRVIGKSGVVYTTKIIKP